MRSLVWLVAVVSLIVGGSASCFAQQTAGPATLEGLLNSDEAQEPTAAADAGPKPPAGTVTRPKDRVQDPDLDKAWADYDVAIAKATETIKAAISEQFDAASTKGDLDAAEKWQLTGEKFEKAGELPSEKETKTAVSAAAAGYKKAREELGKAYEAVVKSLTMEKKIAEAKAVRSELQTLESGASPTETATLPASVSGRQYVKAERSKLDELLEVKCQEPSETMAGLWGKWGREKEFLVCNNGVPARIEQRKNGLVIADMFAGEKSVFFAHPLSQQVPATVSFGQITRTSKGSLLIKVRNTWGGDCSASVFVDGREVNKTNVGGDKWHLMRVPFNKEDVRLVINATQWFREGCFITYQIQ